LKIAISEIFKLQDNANALDAVITAGTFDEWKWLERFRNHRLDV
jgi:hypothetical protein